MKIQDIRKKSETDLIKMIAELRGTVRDLRFRIANKELKNPKQLRSARKDIARILTVLKDKGVKS